MLRKGQAAMEYLMTYGWAILIVVIVAAALFALGVFSPATFVGETAVGFPNLGIPATGTWQLLANGNFNVIINNNLGSQINITQVQATLSGETQTNSASFSVGAGGNHRYEPLVTFTNTPATGAGYSVQVIVTYTIGSGFPQTDTGTFSGTVQ